jgi:hypothetical protein
LDRIGVANESAAFKTWLESAMKSYIATIKKGDVSKLEKMMKAHYHENYVGHEKDGRKLKRPDVIQMMKVNMASIDKFEKMDFKVISAKASGNNATTTESVAMTFLLKNPDPKAKPIRMDVTQTFNGTYVREKNTWRCVKTVTTQEKVLMNGKEFNPAQAGGGKG